MQVRDLQGWPPKWRGVSSVSGHIAHGERGVLIGVRWDLKDQSFTLVMEDEGDRYSAVLEDDRVDHPAAQNLDPAGELA